MGWTLGLSSATWSDWGPAAGLHLVGLVSCSVGFTAGRAWSWLRKLDRDSGLVALVFAGLVFGLTILILIPCR